MKYVLLVIITLGLISCNAPRNNPLDVHNPDRPYCDIQGRVLTQSLPYKPLTNVHINFSGDEHWTLSDGQGHFALTNLKPLPGWIFFEKDGYHPDSQYVEWEGKKSKFVEAHLNALPVLDSLVFYSSIINRYPDVQILELFIKAWLWDNDNDVDSVFLKSNLLGVSLNLQFNATQKYFERSRISLQELNLQLPDELIGHPFDLQVIDRDSRKIVLAQAQIERIIRQEVNLKSPAGGETVNSRPTLRWEPIDLGYSFTYMVEIRTDEVDPRLVWVKKGLTPQISQIQVDVMLPKTPINRYIWAIWIIDRFGNRARSKFKSFQVE